MVQRNLFGTWKLEAVQYEFADTGEFADMNGAKPLGYLMITQDKRMMTIITSDDIWNVALDQKSSARAENRETHHGILSLSANPSLSA